MIRKGRIITDRQATALIPSLPHAHAQVPAWLEEAASASQVRNLFGQANMASTMATVTNAAPPIDYEAQQRAVLQQLEAEREKLKSIQTRYCEGIAKLAAQATARPASPERVLDLVLLIAREVIGREAQTDPSLILEHVERGIDALGNGEPIDVRLTAADAQLVQELKPELAEQVRIVTDESVGPGGCVVENSRTVIDSSLDERLGAVREALAESLSQSGQGSQRRVA